MMAFVRDPILWGVTLAGSVLGMTIPIDSLTSGHGAIFGLLALLGGFFGKVLQVWLQFRQQRAKEQEDNAARFERLLKEERSAHDRELERRDKRIEGLEAELDRRRGEPRA